MNEIDLNDLFKKIISISNTMKRFVVAPGYGNELNKNNLGEILEDVVGGITDGMKYPVCLMFPPVEIPNYNTNWSKFKCKMFFLTTIDDKQKNINIRNNITKRNELIVFNEMSVCAKDFRKTFFKITEAKTLNKIRDSETLDFIERVSNVGNDKSAGVGISFDVEINNGCEIIDYTDANVNDLISSI